MNLRVFTLLLCILQMNVFSTLGGLRIKNSELKPIESSLSNGDTTAKDISHTPLSYGVTGPRSKFPHSWWQLNNRGWRKHKHLRELSHDTILRDFSLSTDTRKDNLGFNISFHPASKQPLKWAMTVKRSSKAKPRVSNLTASNLRATVNRCTGNCSEKNRSLSTNDVPLKQSSYAKSYSRRSVMTRRSPMTNTGTIMGELKFVNTSKEHLCSITNESRHADNCDGNSFAILKRSAAGDKGNISVNNLTKTKTDEYLSKFNPRNTIQISAWRNIEKKHFTSNIKKRKKRARYTTPKSASTIREKDSMGKSKTTNETQRLATRGRENITQRATISKRKETSSISDAKKRNKARILAVRNRGNTQQRSASSKREKDSTSSIKRRNNSQHTAIRSMGTITQRSTSNKTDNASTISKEKRLISHAKRRNKAEGLPGLTKHGRVNITQRSTSNKRKEKRFVSNVKRRNKTEGLAKRSRVSISRRSTSEEKPFMSNLKTRNKADSLAKQGRVNITQRSTSNRRKEQRFISNVRRRNKVEGLAERDGVNITQRSTSNKRKEKRFMSNLKSTLKKHMKNRLGSWAVSRKEAEKMFQRYYQCITNRHSLLQAEAFPIKAFMAVEGEKVMMECSVCYRPDVDAASQRATWQVLSREATDVHALKPGGKVKILKDNTLIIKDIEVNDAGQYFCVEKRDYLAVYQLDVFLTDRRRHLRVGVDEPRPEEFLFDRNLRVYTTWVPWSECNTCDRPGKRIRVGQCTVKKIYPDLPVFPRDYPLMVLYPEGVPCHSTALPRHIRGLRQVSGRHSETLVLPCRQACPTQPPTRVVTDNTGKVLEVLDPGFYSVKEKPVQPPLVKRKVLYEPEKSHLVLSCPGDLDKSVLHWARGERTVDPSFIKRQTKGRVWLDSSVNLHFKPLLLSDTAVYNCWVKNRRVASIKLLVVDEGNQNIKIYISYVGLVLVILGSFLFFFCLCCKKSEHNAR